MLVEVILYLRLILHPDMTHGATEVNLHTSATSVSDGDEWHTSATSVSDGDEWPDSLSGRFVLWRKASVIHWTERVKDIAPNQRIA
jgi:hypothetical protein